MDHGVAIARIAVINSQPTSPATPTIVVTQLTNCTVSGIITITAPLGTGLVYSINGSVYQTSPIFSGLSANCYSVTVKNGTCVSCAKAATIAVFTQGKFAIQSSTVEDFKVSLAPNPFATNFEVVVKSNSDENVNVRIIDLNGRVINQFTSTPQNTIHIGNELSIGSYFIEVTQGDNRKVIRALKL